MRCNKSKKNKFKSSIKRRTSKNKRNKQKKSINKNNKRKLKGGFQDGEELRLELNLKDLNKNFDGSIYYYVTVMNKKKEFNYEGKEYTVYNVTINGIIENILPSDKDKISSLFELNKDYELFIKHIGNDGIEYKLGAYKVTIP